MNDEDYLEQPQEVEINNGSGKSSNSLEKSRQTVENVGSIIEDIGHLEESAAKRIKEKNKATEAATNVGSATSTVASSTLEATEKALEAKKAISTAAVKTAESTEKAAATTEAAARTSQAAFSGVARSGEGMSTASQPLKSNPYTAGAGAGLDAAGKTMSTIGNVGSTASNITANTAAATKNTAAATKTAAQLENAKTDAELAAIKSTKGVAETSKKANELTKKTNEASSQLADKLEKSGKRHIQIGKRIQSAAGKIDSTEIFDNIKSKTGKIGKTFTSIFYDPKMLIVFFLLFIIFAAVIISYLISPMFYMKNILENPITNPDNVEKVSNFFAGLGFKNSEEAFYQEVDYLNNHYGKEIDFSYIMAALYYTDIYDIGTSSYSSTTDDNYCDNYNFLGDKSKDKCNSSLVGINLAKYYLQNYSKEATTTIGKDQLVYSSNKLYRLRELVKHQFSNGEEKTIPLSEYIKLCTERMGNEVGHIMKVIPLLVFYVYAAHNPLLATAIPAIDNLELLNDIKNIFEGTENWESIKLYLKNGKYDQQEEILEKLNNLIETFYNCFFKIKGVGININSLNITAVGDIFTGNYSKEEVLEKIAGLIPIEITYYDYAYDEAKFEDYLVYEYIPQMPEFQKFLLDDKGNRLEGEKLDERALKIGYEIRNVKLIFDAMYKTNESSKEENSCIGDINLDVLAELQPPIDLEDGQTITFSGTNNYGLYKGMMHNGVDLEDTSTATKKGANVYSIYNGKVVESTADDTLSDKTVKGGWLVIEYSVQFEDDSNTGIISGMFKSNITKIRTYYGGMDPQSVKLKQNDTVKKGQVIGKVGDASDSENGTKSSLHFAIYDLYSMSFLNPINMFITCRASSDKMCGSNNEQKIWTFLMSKGYTKEAAAGIMGVWQRESSFKPYIVQSHTDSYSKDYTAKIDNGTITKNKFAKDGPGGGGYGLAQWTYHTRKEKLYDFAKEKGKSIGSLEVQLEFFEKEINSDSFKGVKSKLNDKKTVEEATEYFLTGPYQGGTKASLKERINNAKEIYNKYKDFECK